MNRLTVAVLALVWLSCDEPTEVFKTKSEAGPVVIDASMKLRDAGPPLFTDEPLAIDLDEPLATAEVVGWAADGSAYVVDTKRGLDSGDLAGSRAIELREVRDSRSLELLASFRIERAIDDQVEDHDVFRKAWAQAKPMKAYKAFARDKGIVQDSPAPEGWSISVEVAKKTIPALSKTSAKSAGLTTSLEWRTWEIPKNAAERAAKKRREGVEERPSFDVRLVGPKSTWTVARVAPPYTSTLISEATNNPKVDTIVRGALAISWSPDGSRALLSTTWSAKGLNPEMVRPEAQLVVVTRGPRISLAVPAAERGRASFLVRSLEAKEVLVTSVGFATFKAKIESSVTYRDDKVRALAETIAKELGVEATNGRLVDLDISAIVAPKSAE